MAETGVIAIPLLNENVCHMQPYLRLFSRHLHVTIAVLSIGAWAGGGPETAHHGLVGAWSFDQIDGDRVLGRRGAADALVVRSSRRVKGVRGAALELDGKLSQARCLAVQPFTCRDALSIEAWVRLDPADLLGFRTVVRKEGCYALRFHGRELGLVLWQRAKPTVFALRQPAWPRNEWFHVAATYDGEQVRFYVNGMTATETAFPCEGPIDDAPTEFFVGSHGRTHILRGALDEVRVYNQVLDADTVRARWQAGLAALRAEADTTVEATLVGRGPEVFRKPEREIAMVENGFVWVDAEDFNDYGGWLLDTQYVHLMGSAYLIAAGIGEPVEDATVTFPVPDSGRYHVWVRARNWIPEHAPGRFQIVINGEGLPHTLGAAPSDAWIWEQAERLRSRRGTPPWPCMISAATTDAVTPSS